MAESTKETILFLLIVQLQMTVYLFDKYVMLWISKQQQKNHLVVWFLQNQIIQKMNMIVLSSETISKINIIVFSSQIIASIVYNFHIHLHLDSLAIYMYTSLTSRSRMSLADCCTKPTRRSQSETDREHRNSLQF